MDIDIYGEAPDKLTYTEQANKRTNCKRLTWYMRYLTAIVHLIVCITDIVCGSFLRIFISFQFNNFLLSYLLYVILLRHLLQRFLARI